MSIFPPTTTVYNDGYISESYEAYRRDPSSVDESWRQFFRFAESLSGTARSTSSEGVPQAIPASELLAKVAAAAKLVDSIRTFGHLAVSLDPLGTPAQGT